MVRIPVKDEISPLREEIVQSENGRADFVKWKLIAVAVLGAAGLGIGQSESKPIIPSAYVLCIIPFVCIYVDAICAHINLRILVIGCFLRDNGDQYENFIADLEMPLSSKDGVRYLFKIEDYVLWYSTILLSALIAFMGFIILSLIFFKEGRLIMVNEKGFSFIMGIVFIATGVAGVVMSALLQKDYERRKKVLYDADKMRMKLDKCDIKGIKHDLDKQ